MAPKRITAIFLIFGLVMAQPLYAASTWRNEIGYGDRVQGKFLYGIANFFGGWLALIEEPARAKSENRNVALGVVRGVVNGAWITAGGLAHFLTSPITFLDIPLPNNGVDLQVEGD